jgi:hypothetical protein
MSSKRVEGILGEADVEYRAPEGDFSALTEHPTLGTEGFVRYITPLRLFLGFGPDVGGKRPSTAFFEALMSSGRDGAIALLRAWENSLPDAGAPETRRTVEAAALAVRVARVARLVDWSIDDYRPEASGTMDGRERIGVYLPSELARSARVMAAEAGTSLSAVVEGAVAAALAKSEKPRARVAGGRS